ncbi:HAD hydrolase-like protein [Thermogemmatispora sp.]|uniref:HAD hydrolase-like protein n=1 Tax=Thermogemmatispora sp. TaxID=1968838 RepID=UPI001DB4265B|nr:HAD hydrolase-like protein [Thermogemmatispora sp.]MBX5448470.1 HAD family hydrolase [Thermogemmatispora sp.]
MKTLIVFDLDGVITSEDAYWDAAGLTLHELLYSPRYWNVTGQRGYEPVTGAEESRLLSRSTLPEEEILLYKALALNSNWDTCYAAVCWRLIALLEQVLPAHRALLLPLRPWEADWLARLRSVLATQRAALEPRLGTLLSGTPPFAGAPFSGIVGLELLNRYDAYASARLGLRIEGVFSRLSPFWDFCRSLFQEWYLGEELYSRTYGHPPAQAGKPGCIHFERPLLPPEALRETLDALRAAGYVLGLATGRCSQEATLPLQAYDLLSRFDPEHVCTYDAVEAAETELRRAGDTTLLSKPHPFQFLYALDRRGPSAAELARPRPPFIVVGDSSGDILGGRAAGALTVATLSGARSQEARQRLLACAPDFVIDDVCRLPSLLAEVERLESIQRLQFEDRAKAERLLRWWFARQLDLLPEQVTLTPRPVSLNSFNGTYEQNGERYFFKTHVEEQSALSEYYHAELLRDAGYNMVLPLRVVRQEGRQMVIYPLVQWPVMFDLMRAVETGAPCPVTAEILVAAERRACQRLLEIYRRTGRLSSAEEHATAPIHQLFWHRLTGGRLTRFYRGQSIPLPSSANARTGQSEIGFEDLLRCRWVVNGEQQQRTLGELLEEAQERLHPRQAALTVIGHGDAHFGNIFLEHERDYLYFDPAFAGRHAVLLDIVKPLYHNVFASWMYFPQETAQGLTVRVALHHGAGGEWIEVMHSYQLAPIRQAILITKVQTLLRPLLSWLKEEGALPADWDRLLALALLCCPLLTINLLDHGRIPPAVCWLGLTQAVLLGNAGLLPWRTLLESEAEDAS